MWSYELFLLLEFSPVRKSLNCSFDGTKFFDRLHGKNALLIKQIKLIHSIQPLSFNSCKLQQSLQNKMLVMAITAILAFASFIFVVRIPNIPAEINHYIAIEENYSESCSLDNAIANAPKCEPRLTIINLPNSVNPEVIEIIPSKIEVQRCSGACHEVSETIHKCVPSSIINKTIEVNNIDVGPGAGAIAHCYMKTVNLFSTTMEKYYTMHFTRAYLR